MRKSISLFIVLGVAAPLLATAASSPPAAPTNARPAAIATTNAASEKSIIAKGKAVSVTRNELDEELVRIKATLAAQGRGLPGDNPSAIERQVLDSLISKQLLLTRTTAADKAKGREEFLTTLEKFKTNGHVNEEEFNQKLNQQLQILGLTKQQWEDQGIEQATLPITLQRELSISVTDEAVKKFYADNPGKFEQPQMVKAAHILLMTSDPATRKELPDEQKAAKKKQMEDILKRARTGEDFGKLAKEYSDDPGSKDKGGEYTFPRGQMMPEFEAAAFSLNTNQVSDIVTTSYGYHIIKLYEKIPAKVVEYSQVASDIKEYLTQQEIRTQVPSYIEKLRKEADVQILDEKLKAVEVPAAPGAGGPQVPPITPRKQGRN